MAHSMPGVCREMSKLVEASCNRLRGQMNGAIAECHKGLECLKDKTTPYAESIAYLISVYERILNVLDEEQNSGIDSPSEAYKEDIAGNGGYPDGWPELPPRVDSIKIKLRKHK